MQQQQQQQQHQQPLSHIPPGANPNAPMLRSLYSTSQPHHNQSFRVKFEKLAFFEYLADLGGPNMPIKLTPVNNYMKPYSTTFQFVLGVDETNQVVGSRKKIPDDGRVEHTVQVHLRFGYYEQAQPVQRDILPPNLIVNVNGKPASLPTPKPTSKPNSDIIRPGRSIDITPQIKWVPNSPNKVDLTWSDEKVKILGI
jgi:hypothetical protein